MGQYWYVVNLDKKEFVRPHRLDVGLKLWEQLASHPGTGGALIVLCAAMRERRGGGDFDDGVVVDYDPKSGKVTHTPTKDPYFEIAKRTIGRWAGDRIALVGDYAEDGDLPKSEDHASEIYDQCSDGEYTDISPDVATVIEHELDGHFEPKESTYRDMDGNETRHTSYNWIDERDGRRTAIKPDIVLVAGPAVSE